MTDTVKHFEARRKPARSRWILGIFVATLTMLVCLLRWGGYLLIASDPTPVHVDAAVVLQGSISGERRGLLAPCGFCSKEFQVESC